jgi:hypothetical protein
MSEMPLGFYICYYCAKPTGVCPSCQSYPERQAACDECNRTGGLCATHGKDWLGSEPCPPDRARQIGDWVRVGMTTGRFVGETDLPCDGEDELSYLAFICDVNAVSPGMGFTDATLRQEQWLVRCRNLAVEAGGRAPRVVRSYPLPTERTREESPPSSDYSR